MRKRIYVPGARPDVQVPFTEVTLSDGEPPVRLYDSGATAADDDDLPPLRAGWIADYNDAQNFLALLETRTGPQNYGRYSNPEFDRLMLEAENTQDLEQRGRLMAQAEAIAMEDQPVIPIYYYVSKNLVSGAVQGWQDNTKDVQRTRWLSVQR